MTAKDIFAALREKEQNGEYQMIIPEPNHKLLKDEGCFDAAYRNFRNHEKAICERFKNDLIRAIMNIPGMSQHRAGKIYWRVLIDGGMRHLEKSDLYTSKEDAVIYEAEKLAELFIDD